MGSKRPAFKETYHEAVEPFVSAAVRQWYLCLSSTFISPFLLIMA